MQLTRFKPRPQLNGLIDSLWLFESPVGLPVSDSRVVAPNGKAKLIYSYENGLSAAYDNLQFYYKPCELLLIGPWDKPVVLSSEICQTATLGVEFTIEGLQYFTRFKASEIRNGIFSITDLYGKEATLLEYQLLSAAGPLDKLNVIQDFLLSIFNDQKRHILLAGFCASAIRESCGMLQIKALEKKTGYSGRYLDMIFNESIGLSPKELIQVVKFQAIYTTWATSNNLEFYTSDLYDLYYDQSHFIKEFKKFTGYTPRNYAAYGNNFGKIFYRR